VAALFFAESALLAFFGGVAGFFAGSLLAHRIGRSIFDSQITIQPVLFPVILAIAVLVTFGGVPPRSGARCSSIQCSRCGETHERSQPIQQGVAARRVGSPHSSMFLRMLWRAAALRRGRAASALLAMVVAAAVATAMMNLYVDVQAKLRKEFRSYGANVVVVGQGWDFPSATC